MAGRRISFGEGVSVFIYFDRLWSAGILRPYSVLYVFTDNVIVEHTINNRSAKTKGTSFWAAPLFELCYKRKVLIRALRITSKNNVLAPHSWLPEQVDSFVCMRTMCVVQSVCAAYAVQYHVVGCVRDFGSRLTIAGNSSPTLTELNVECARIFKNLTTDQTPHHNLIARGMIQQLDMVCPRVVQIQVCSKYRLRHQIRLYFYGGFVVSTQH